MVGQQEQANKGTWGRPPASQPLGTATAGSAGCADRRCLSALPLPPPCTQGQRKYAIPTLGVQQPTATSTPTPTHPPTCRATTGPGSSLFFMWLQAWNCWLMQHRKRKEEDQTSHHTGAPAAAVSSRPAAKGAEGLKSCRRRGRKGEGRGQGRRS
jgi:hypothetical protein